MPSQNARSPCDFKIAGCSRHFSWSADVNLWFHRAVGIHVGYERAAVLPGFKFGYWSASGALYGLVRWGMEEFIVAVAEDSPGYVPILTS